MPKFSLFKAVAFSVWCASSLAQAQLDVAVSPSSSINSAPAQPAAQGAGIPLTPLPSLRLAPSLDTRGTILDSAEIANKDTALRVQRKAQTANQFQQFVQDATGRKLNAYGAELFDSADAYAADASVPPPGDYVLGTGDEVRVQIWGAVDYNGVHTLDRNGQISLPKIGVILLNGVPVRNLEAAIRSQVAKVYANFDINANLGRLRSIQVYVVGQAQQPGTYKISSLSSLVNALFISGGPNANGSMRNIQLKRANRVVTTFDLYDFIAKGDKSRDVSLQAGDVIVIPPIGARVAVTGALDQAAIYELKAGASTISDVLSINGGLPTLANLRKASLERIAPEKNPPRQVQEIILNPEGLKLGLRDGDVLTLFGISPAFGNAVTLQGAVAAPLRYSWFDGMRILDLIPERDALITGDYHKRKNALVQINEASKEAGSRVAGRAKTLAEQINWEYAVIERLNKDQLTTELIPFNLGKAVLSKDPLHNLPLLSGDVVTILSQSDIGLPQARQTRLIRVEGEVAAPGIYQSKPGETLVQLLQRIGGVTPQAYLFGAEFTRASVREQQQENLAQLIRRLEAQLQSQANATVSNLRTDNAEQAQAQAVQQQLQVQARAQINRIKSLRSSGRISLELEPTLLALAALPDLPLEDGDRIVIPSVPSFIAAYGSVNNENVFIFKTGKTARDVIKSAGLTDEADIDQMFILRADGSVISRRDRRSSLFGGSDFESIALMPGDSIVVPATIDRENRYNILTRVLKDWTQIFANFGLGVAAVRSISKN